MLDSIVIAGALVAVATLAGPTLATKFAPEIDKIKADAESAIAKAEADAEKIKVDVNLAYNAMKTRAEAAESVLARFLPSGTPGPVAVAPVAAKPVLVPSTQPATTTQLSPAELTAAFGAPVIANQPAGAIAAAPAATTGPAGAAG